MFKYHGGYTFRIIILFFIIENYFQNPLGQTQTIIFGQGGNNNNNNNNQQMPQPALNAPQTGANCNCVTVGTCAASSTAGIDIRIVNTGTTACNPGMQYCCTNGNSAGLTDGSCGIRKISLTPQPAGTASYGAYPWQAALLTTGNSYIGSGVLLDANNILTVAHKVSGLAVNGFKVRLGEWNGLITNEQYPYQEYFASRVFIHPAYNAQNLQNDVAIIRLSTSVPVATSPGISTICPPTGIPPAQTRCWVSGWGKNAFGPTGVYQGIMKEVDVPILDQNDCESRLRGTRLGQFFTLSRSSFMCAGGEMNKDACTGDGGSPLVCQIQGQWQVVGLVAWGIGCASAGVPGVYVNISNYLTWIMQQIGTAA